MPSRFSRIAGRSPRVSTASTKLFAIVSATVSTAGPAMLIPPSPAPPRMPALTASPFSKADPYSTPSFLLFSAPFASRARFLGPEIEFLDVLGVHQPLATVIHDDPADLQNITIMRRLQCNLGILLDQQDRHAMLFIDTPDDGENLLHQDRRQPQRRLIEQQQCRPVHQCTPDRQHLLLTARELPGRLVEPLLQPRKISADPLQVLSHRLAIAARISPHHQVLAHGEERKHLAPLRHVAQA